MENGFGRALGRGVAGAAARALLDLVWDGGDAVAVLRSADLTVLEANRTFEELVGPRREVVGEQLAALGPWREASGFAPLLRAGAVDGEPVTLLGPWGEPHLLHCWAKPARVGAGDEQVTVMVVRDTTESSRTERLLAAEHALSRKLAEARTVREGAAVVVRTLCERLAWRLGDWWEVDEAAGLLRFSGVIWRHPRAPAGGLEPLAPTLTFRRGETMAGLAWERGEPVWDEDPGVHCYDGLGPHTGMAFPAATRGRVLGVFAFCMPPQSQGRPVRPVDRAEMEAVAAIGHLFALFALATPEPPAA